MAWFRRTPPASPAPDPRVFARCVVVGCPNHCWAMSDLELERHAEAIGWVETPAGWVCRAHVIEQLARTHVGRGW